MKTKRRREEGDIEEPTYQEDRIRVVTFFEAIGVGAGGDGTAWTAAHGATTVEGETLVGSFPARDVRAMKWAPTGMVALVHPHLRSRSQSPPRELPGESEPRRDRQRVRSSWREHWNRTAHHRSETDCPPTHQTPSP